MSQEDVNDEGTSRLLEASGLELLKPDFEASVMKAVLIMKERERVKRIAIFILIAVVTEVSVFMALVFIPGFTHSIGDAVLQWATVLERWSGWIIDIQYFILPLVVLWIARKLIEARRINYSRQ